ncbi:SNF2 family N-terminal domain-containing protein [Pelagophyceae sp. CCMP2097]|nr:SNF2 family N-terminal domain-containing protein [Pelagophyceae sp. CCMP2097]
MPLPAAAAPAVAASELTASEIASIYSAAARGGADLDASAAARLRKVFGARVSLLPHQRRAVRWMLARDAAGGGVLADAPGLGKTLTVLAVVSHDWAECAAGARRPTLVVVPSHAIREQWAREASRFWGAGAKIACYDGPPKPFDLAVAAREVSRLRGAALVLVDLDTLRREQHFRSAELAGNQRFFSVLFRAGSEVGGAWRRIVVDEVQDLSGGPSTGAAVANALRSDRRWGISGTPLGKGAAAMHNLLALVGADQYGDAKWWTANVRNPLQMAGPADAAARGAALEHMRRAAAIWIWRSAADAAHEAADGADPARALIAMTRATAAAAAEPDDARPADLRLKLQDHVPTVVCEPSAAELAATAPALAALLRGALLAAKRAGLESDERELSTRDAKALLAAGDAPGAAKSKKADGASFASLCRSATAAALGDSDAHKQEADAPAAVDDGGEASWVQCELCDKWRRLPTGANVGEGKWMCADSRGWPGAFAKACADGQEEGADDDDGPSRASPAQTQDERRLAESAPSSLGAVLRRVEGRCGARGASTVASFAQAMLARAAAMLVPENGIDEIEEARKYPNKAAVRAAALLEALCLARHGAPQDEVAAVTDAGPNDDRAEGPTVGSTVVAATLSRLEVEHRLALLRDAFANVANRRVADRRVGEAASGDAAGDAASGAAASCVFSPWASGARSPQTHDEAACAVAVAYERSRRRVASAMAGQRRLGAASAARKMPRQLWPRVWAFVDAGAGDLVAEVLERAAAFSLRHEAHARVGAAVSELAQRGAARRKRRSDAAFVEASVDAVRAAIVGALDWQDPANFKQRAEWLQLWRAGKLGVPWALAGRPRTWAAPRDAPGDDEGFAEDQTPAQRRLAQDQLRCGPPPLFRGASDAVAPALVDRAAVAAADDERGFFRACRIAKSVRDAVAGLGDPRNTTVGLHEVRLQVACRAWCAARVREDANGCRDGAAAVADEVVELLRTAAAARHEAVDYARALIIEVTDKAKFDAIDAPAARQGARALAARAAENYAYRLVQWDMARTAIAVSAAALVSDPGAMVVAVNLTAAAMRVPRLLDEVAAPFPMPARLRQHARCMGCAVQAWRLPANLRRAHQTWGALTLCALCSTRKRASLAKGFVSTAVGSFDSGLVKLVLAATDCAAHDAMAGARGATPAEALAMTLGALRRDVEAAARASRAADDWAGVSVAFRKATVDGAFGTRAPAGWKKLATLADQRDDVEAAADGATSASLRECRAELSGRISASALPRAAELAARLALADSELADLRARLRDARRNGAYARAVAAARGEREFSPQCANCSAAQTPETAAGARIAPCAHMVCGACVSSLADGDCLCRRCGEAHVAPWKTQALVETREPSAAPRTDFGAKLDRVAADVAALVAAKGEKCLIFSQWGDALDLARVALASRGVQALLLRGGRAAPKILAAFADAKSGVSALLMPLKTSNAGLNLSCATHVFLLDTGLAPALEVQALARVRRLDSPGRTKVYRYVLRSSVEEAIWLLRRSKSRTDDITVLETSITRKDVFSLLETMLQKAEAG